MLKLSSNGGSCKTLLSLRLKQLFMSSTSSSTSKAPSFTVNFMVTSLGFSTEEAITASKKVSTLNNKVSPKPDLVLEFLKKRGFSNAQIKKLVYSMPNLLFVNVDKTLNPKFNALQEMGVAGSDLVRIASSNPLILRIGLRSRLTPVLNFLKSIVFNHQHFLIILRRSYWLMSCNVDTILRPNLELLRGAGLSDERIRNLLLYNPTVLGLAPEKFASILRRIDEEFEIPRDTLAFVDGITLLAALSEETLQCKFNLFKSYGFTESDIMTVLRKHARCFMLSETGIRSRLEFFLNELGYEPTYIAVRPYVLVYSIKDRVVPRITILKILQEKKLINKLGILAVVCFSEDRFVKNYVLPYKDKLPELCEAYICRKKGCSSVKGVC